MPRISAEEVKKVARLAGLRIEDSRIPAIQEDFEKILDHFSSLNELNLEGVEPLYHLIAENHLRNDEAAAETLNRKELLSNSPDHDESHFRLGRILGGAE
jgi:aspartyl-tRNA(Asn)/glutamyl-tRNA(Gln) amidotransferase subunit C